MTPLQGHTPQDRLDAHLQFGHAEGLGQVVVGAPLKTADTIGLGAQRRHQDHRRGAAQAQLGQCIQAVEPGQQDVHEHHIEGLTACRFKAFEAIAAPGHLEATPLQLFVQIGAQYRVILDGEDVGSVNSYGIHWQLSCILNCAIIEHPLGCKQPPCDQCLAKATKRQTNECNT